MRNGIGVECTTVRQLRTMVKGLEAEWTKPGVHLLHIKRVTINFRRFRDFHFVSFALLIHLINKPPPTNSAIQSDPLLT